LASSSCHISSTPVAMCVAIMVRLLWALSLTMTSAQDIFLAARDRAIVQSTHPVQVPSPQGAMPCIPLKNAAKPGMCYPMTGLGIRGEGYKIGQKEECWHYPDCCTKDYCPAVNAVRDWLKMGGKRIDTGYPFGDTPGTGTCGSGETPDPREALSSNTSRRLGHAFCDPHGTKKGIAESGVAREDIFITIKSGFAGPMQGVQLQGGGELDWLGEKYADLYLMHEGDLGNPGHHPAKWCEYPTTDSCRLKVWQSCLEWMKQGKTKACGVANWELKWLQKLKAEKVTLPAVVQMKFHLHQSFASQRIQDIKAFCDENGILFNGYSPLGRADWTVFDASVGTPTTLEEPIVLDIAKRLGRSPAQVILRWHVELGIATQPRTMNTDHMKENLDVFGDDWKLSDEDMAKLSNMKQCTTIRGDPFMPGDPDDDRPGHSHPNMIGPTATC